MSATEPCPGCGASGGGRYPVGDRMVCWPCFSARTDPGDATDGRVEWLAGSPMDPTATPAEKLPPLAGFPFVHAGAGVVIVGPTGGGRSSLVQACLYDGTAAGLRGAYLGSEVTEPEFNARAAILADLRGDRVDEELRARLARVRYLNLASVITHAWAHPDGWITGVTSAYDVVVIDPLSAVASALDLNFDQSNAEFVKFYDRLVQPVTAKGVTVGMVDNVGHALEARSRAKGASAKSDRADLTFSCALLSTPPALVIKAHKVRTVRAPFQRGDEWIFYRDSQTIERRQVAAAQPTETFRPTTLMRRVSETVSAEPGISKRAIRQAISGRNEYIDKALNVLITEGYIDKRADGHHSLKPFDVATDDGPPCPDRAPQGVPTVPTVPHSVPTPCPAPDEQACPRAIHTELYGHGAPSSHNGHPNPDPDAEQARIVAKFPDLAEATE
ncbi:MAG: hypothetical protein ACLP01_16655 [Solirubrobacteraceae bacterium]